MKPLLRLTLLLVAMAWCLPAHATLTCAQGATGCTVTTARNCNTTSPTTSCTITVTSTHAGAIEVICSGSNGNTSLSSTSDGGFTQPAAAHLFANAVNSTCAYNLNATGGVTSIVCTFTPTESFLDCSFLEFTKTLSPAVFDTANTHDAGVCSTCVGTALTLGTSNNYLLIQAGAAGGTLSAIDNGYTAAFNGNGSGIAYKINVTVAGTTPNWTNNSTQATDSGLAIYETPAAGGVSGVSKRRKLSKLGSS